MTCSAQVMPSAIVHQSWLQAAQDGLGRLWQTYWEYRQRQATAYLLQSLSDRTLADIGVHRSEIDSVAYGGSGDRARDYHPVWE
jgi:uncharacterized protein YjiS (DUF1127 family)